MSHQLICLLPAISCILLAFHKFERWMTQGLLVSRRTKISLEHLHANNPTDLNLTKYKNYRNIYNSTVRLCKKLFYAHELDINSKNLRKTWSILNDVLQNLKISNRSQQLILMAPPSLILQLLQLLLINFLQQLLTKLPNSLTLYLIPTLSRNPPLRPMILIIGMIMHLTPLTCQMYP
jgi:hypothetical protein